MIQKQPINTLKGIQSRWLTGNNPPSNEGTARDSGLIPWSGRSHGGGNGNPLQ